MATFNWGTDYAQVGGKEVSVLDVAARYNVSIKEPYIDFGAMPRFTWGDEMDKLAHEAEQRMAKFSIRGRTDPSVKKALLYEVWRHPQAVSALGYAYPGSHQLSGSCVGAAYCNVAFALSAIEVIRLNQPEQIVVPFWLFTYGRGRLRSGMRSPGEGSSGTGQAEAARLDGIVEATRAGLPTFKNTDGLIWGSNVEVSWSDGDARQSLDLLPEANKHLVKTVAKIRSADEAREALINGYPITIASMDGFNARVEGEGQDALLIGRRGPRWSHQMSLSAWMEHPRFGEVFYEPNQWGLNAHGKDPFGAPPGGVWRLKSDIEWAIRDGDECFAFSQFDGFPAQTFEWGVA